MKKRNRLTTAAALMVASGLFNVLVFGLAVTRLVDAKSIIGVAWIISPLPYFGVASGFTGKEAISNVLAVCYFVGIIASIAGGAWFWLRKTVIPGVIGAAGAMLCFPLVGLAAAVLALTSRPKSND